MNYRRKPDQVVIPYPYLTEPTNLSIAGISNTYTNLPAQFSANTWYFVQANQTITVPANHTLVIVRESSDNVQNVLWTTAPSGSTLQVNLQANDFVLVYAGGNVPIEIAGFETLYLVDVADQYEIRTYISFKSNIRFRFTRAN